MAFAPACALLQSLCPICLSTIVIVVDTRYPYAY